jgi:hypothetical protein
MLDNYNLNPYYDDYNDDKNFHRLLFKPSFAVQARELTQIQTILQKQVERFGNHVFKNGSVVTGGQYFFQESISLKLDNDYSGTTVDVANIDNKTILSIDDTKRAEVIKVYDADPGTGDPKTIIVKQLYGDSFTPGQIIKTKDDSPYYANISANGVTTSKTFSVNEGIFYFKGYFIKTLPQTIAISKYTNANVHCRVGFDVVESVVKASADTSLLDPALGSSNYQAPGADRVKLELVLAIRTLDSIDDDKFIELVRIEESQITNENKYPIYSVLEETLARRTYDESGNYVVRPFKISLEDNSANSAQTDIILSPGKAYVYGYEFNTNSPTVITVDKPRDVQVIQNKRITGEYGNFLYTSNHYGSFPINTLGTVDIHCVPRASINTTSTGTISNTKIGSAKVKTVEYESSSNTSNSQTYVYRTFLFDVAVNQQITGNVVSASGTTIVIGNGSDLFSNTSNSYQGAKLRITKGRGAGEPAKTILSYNGPTRTLTINQPFLITPNTSSVFSLDFDVKDAESLSTYSGTSLVNSADIDSRSKDFSKTYQDVYLADSKLEPMIFTLGEEFITPNTISDMSFSYKRLYTSQVFSSSDSPSLGVGTGESLASGISTSSRNDNFIITVISQGSSPYPAGSIIPSDKFTVDTATRKITVIDGENMTTNIVATIDVSNPTRKSKVYVAANTTIQTTGGVDVFSNSAVVTYGTQGQTHIAANYVNKVPSTSQSLFVSDINNIISILDFNGLAITEQNKSAASEVITKYDLDNGQRDSYYDHGSIRLKAGVRPPVGPLVVLYDRFTSSGPGFFTVDSYTGVPYGNIPVYTSPTNNNIYQLRDVLDFRPVRSDATVGSGSSVLFDVDSSTTGPKILKNGSDIIIDYNFYLPRIDKIVLDKTKKFEVVKGNAELNPAVPNDTDNTMTLYILRNGAYVANTSQIQVEYKNNKRYTMRDIGTLEKRIENLEYFTSLSLLEQDTTTKQDLTTADSNGLQRFKNGILVDSFTGSGVADVTNEDYTASIDPRKKELRPSFSMNAYSLKFDPDNSTNFLQSGPFVTSSAAAVTLIDQPKASRYINVNPFNVINYLGKITLDPPSDIWTDTITKPDVLVNLAGDLDAWEYLTQNAGGTEWGNWETRWTGTSINTPAWRGWLGPTGTYVNVYAPETKTTTENQTRTGVTSTVVPETITQSIGDRVVDVSVIPYMREKGVLFTGTDFKPNTPLYPFFDNVPVVNNVARANKFTLVNNDLNYRTETGNAEAVTIRNNTTNTSNGSALIIKTAGNVAYVVNMSPTTTFNFANMSLVGDSTGTTHVVSSYEHYTGQVVSATANTVVMALDSTGASNTGDYVGSMIRIIAGVGAGQSAVISSYNAVNRTVTITGTWTTTPNNTSVYSIGTLKTSDTGAVAGVFIIPGGVFRVGEKLFRLVDNASGDIGSSSTNGDASFYAQGVLQTTEETIVSATVPTIQRTAVSDSRVVTSTVVTRQVVIGYWDPLAQTFLVSPAQFPEGVFISKVRLCFKGKDDTIPVTMQLRPTVNGYPSSSVVYPHGTVSLTPDKVKVTDSPSMEDPTKYTDFTFDTPIYMQPGEHSFVVLANSNKYETYIAEIGKTDLVENRLISDQAYGGSLFLSQNGSTWTADQSSDMMFKIFRYTFSTAPTTASFVLDYPETSATPYDLTHLITGDMVIANTSLNYQFNSETVTAGYVGYQPISPLTDYDMNDGFGTRIFDPATGNSTFVLSASLNNLASEVSPFIDVTRMGFVAVNNKINNLGLSNTNIIVTNIGDGYANTSDVDITITGGGGSGALAEANVVGGTIDRITIVDPGSNYTGTPTITITPGSGGGANATAIIVGETSKRGGPAAARYISRRVTLNDGFDSGDIRVYLTAYRPKESNIHVYVKLLSVSDSNTFEDREWQLLTPVGNANFVSSNSNDYRELTFAPGENGVPDNSISYTSNGVSYDTFRTFAIKIVMAGTNSSDVPKIRDMRAVALPASVQ